jgi:hypothetical protein
VFSLVPESLITRIPFIGNIVHLETTFTCPLIIITCVLSGFGFAQFVHGNEENNRSRFWVFMALLLCLAALFHGSTSSVRYSDFFMGYFPSLLLATTAMAWMLSRTDSQRYPLFALTIACLSACVLLWRHVRQVENRFDYYVFNPKVRVDMAVSSPSVEIVRQELRAEPARVLGLGNALYLGYAQFLRFESINGVDALRNRHFDELARTFKMRRTYFWDGQPMREEDHLSLHAVHSMLNVRYYLAPHKPERDKVPQLVLREKSDLDIFENPDVWPRAFFTNSILQVSGVDSFAAAIRAGDFKPVAAIDLSELTRLRGPDTLPRLPDAHSPRTVIHATSYKLTANTTSFLVHASTAGVVVLTEAWYPDDFIATLNGVRTPYFRVNHAFKGIYVPIAGDYEVRFEYRPANTTKSILLGGLGLVLFAALAFWHLRPTSAPP